MEVNNTNEAASLTVSAETQKVNGISLGKCVSKPAWSSLCQRQKQPVRGRCL